MPFALYCWKAPPKNPATSDASRRMRLGELGIAMKDGYSKHSAHVSPSPATRARLNLSRRSLTGACRGEAAAWRAGRLGAAEVGRLLRRCVPEAWRRVVRCMA